MILSKKVIEEAAKNRPAGYLEDVYSYAEFDGDNVSISNEDYAALKRKYSGPTTEERIAHEPICRGCEWLNKVSLKCMHPKCGCPLDVGRVEPWANLKKCPVDLF